MVEIVERTDGIPLFVEAMTKAVLEAESEGAARRTVAAVPSPALAVPVARIADGAARSARPSQGGGADRVGDRPGVLPCAALLELLARKSEADSSRMARYFRV
jgi:hypothetical protein